MESCENPCFISDRSKFVFYEGIILDRPLIGIDWKILYISNFIRNFHEFFVKFEETGRFLNEVPYLIANPQLPNYEFSLKFDGNNFTFKNSDGFEEGDIFSGIFRIENRPLILESQEREIKFVIFLLPKVLMNFIMSMELENLRDAFLFTKTSISNVLTLILTLQHFIGSCF